MSFRSVPVELYVTHIQKEGGVFLKIFGQNDRNASVFVERLLLQVTGNAGKHIGGIPQSKSDLYKGQLCCARFDDGKYYRAKVKDLHSLLPNIVTLSFIDYGNTHNVDLSDIRLINSEPLLTVAELATEYYLAEVMPISNDWEDSTIEFIKDKLNYVELKCQVLSEVCGKKLVQIIINNVDFKQILFHHHLAIQVSLQIQQNLIQQFCAPNREVPKQFTVPPPSIIIPPQPTVITHVPRNVPPPTFNMVQRPIPPSAAGNYYPVPRHGIPVELQRKISSTTPEPQHFVCDVLQPGSTHYVYISHVEDGPVSFAVQLKPFAENELTKLMAELNDHEPKPISGPLIPGSPCLGRFTEDQSLCRASVMHVMDDKCKVYYVDFGNSEVLPYSQIYEIPPKYLSMQVMATRFTLSGTRNTQYTNEMKDHFKKIVTDKLLTLKVTPTEGNPLKQYCELFLDGKNVKELLQEKLKQMPLVYAKVHPPVKGTKERVVVSFVENVQKLFVQFEEKKQALKNLMAKLGIHCNSGQAAQLTQDRLFAGLPCCALYSGDQLWYRAQVLSVIRDAANILFVDYGNQETVPTSALREISRELVTELRPQALQCSLNGFQEGSDRDQSLTSRLDELAAENTFTMVVVDVLSNQTGVVDLINDENVSLATLLSPPLPSRLSSSSYSSESSSFDQGVGKKNKVGGMPDKGQHSDSEDYNKKPFQRPGYDGKPRAFDDGGTGRRFKINEKRRDDISYDKKDDNTSNWKNKDRDWKEDSTRGWKNKDNDWKEDGTSTWKNRDRDRKDENTGGWKNKDRDRKDENTGGWRNKDRDRKDENTGGWRNKDIDWKGDNAGGWKNKDTENWEEENTGSFKHRDRDRREDSTRSDNWKHKDKDDNWKHKDKDDNWKHKDKDDSWKHKDKDDSWKHKDKDDSWKHKDKEGWNNRDRDDGRGGGNFGKRGNNFDRGDDNWNRKYSDRDNESMKTFNSVASEESWDTNASKDTFPSSGNDNYDKQYRNRDFNQRGKFNRDDSGSGGDFGRNKFENKENDRFKFNSGRDNFRRGGGGGRDGGGDAGEGGGFKRFNRDKDDNFSGKSVSTSFPSFASKFESTAPALSIPLPSVTVGSCETVEPVSTVSPHEFYVQLENSIDALEAMQKTIADTYGSGGGEPLETMKRRIPCIAQFSEDQVWYRGIIETVYANSVTVFFVDYGNSEDVKIDNLKAITSDLCELPRQAIKCSLYGTKPLVPDEWSGEECQLFMDTVLSKKLKAHFVGKVYLSKALQVVMTDIESGVNINTMFGATDEEVADTVDKMHAIELKDSPVQVGATEDIQITWFISPSHFYVQPLSSNLEFRAMVESMQEIAKSGTHVPTNKLNVSDTVIARYKEDKCLYRAKVKETGLAPVVQYVDYGNYEKVESGNVWSMEPQFAQMPIQAVRCSLAGVMPIEETWTKNSQIDSFFDAERFACTFLSQLDSDTQVFSVKLVNGEKDVAEQLLSNNLVVEGKEETHLVGIDENESNEMELGLLTGQSLCVKGCHVESEQTFYVHLLPAFATSVQEQINNGAAEKQKLEPLAEEHISCGTLCLCLHSDNNYYRSKIIDTSVPIVQFIDVGSVHHTSFDKLYSNLEELSKIPAQATECALSCSAYDFPEDLEAAFKTETEDKKFIIYVDAVQNETLQVKLFERSGELLVKFQPGLKDQVDSLEPVCPLPILRSHQKVYISDANNSGIYLQKSENSNLLAQLLDELYNFYNESEYVEQEWTVGMLCCALSNADSQWYRSRIISIEDSNYNIHYIDYGNGETVEATNLRKLDSAFYDPHILAVSVTFHVEWVVPIETLMELVTDTEYNAVILKNDGNWTAELMDLSGQSLTEKLVELGFVTALDNSPFKRVVEGGRFVEGSTIPVAISHIDSPSQIWLHINGDLEIVEELQDRLQEAAFKLKNLKEPPSPSTLFAAKFTDGMWYRSRLLHDSVVRFIDYGNMDNVDMSDIKELTPEFLEPSEGYAVKCELLVEPKHGVWSHDVIHRLEELLLSDVEEEVTAHVLAVKESSILVDLKVGLVSVTDTLLNENLADKPVELFTGYICHMDSPDSFYVQQEGCEGELSEIAEILLSADSFEPIANTAEQIGQLIAAMNPVDEQWYRAKLLEVNDGTASVLFVDYGNFEITTEFKTLPQELASKEPLARHCALKKPEHIEEWPEMTTEKFNELIAGGSTAFTVKVMVKDEPDIVVLTHNDQCVSLELSKCENEEQAQLIDANEIATVSVLVTHVNSPNDFYVQYKSSEQDVSDINGILTDIINSDPVILNDENMKKVLAAQSSTDRKWYRVKVTKNLQPEVEVFLIDYGINDSSTKLRELPQYLGNKPPLAVHCTLNIDDCSEVACEKFKELVENCNELNMELIEEGDISVVNLYSNKCDIKQSLLTLCHELSEDESSGNTDAIPLSVLVGNEEISSSDFEIGFISYGNTPSDFYIHRNGVENVLDDLMEKLSAVNDADPLDESDLSVGSVVAAKFSDDNLWYRAEIIDKHDGSAKVLFIDYGNTAVATNFRAIPHELSEEKPLALHCSLQFPEGADRWTEEACELFFDLTSGSLNTAFEYKIIKSGEPNTVSLLTDGNSVEEMLSKFNHEDIDYTITDIKPDVGSSSVYVSHTNDPSSFYVQYKGYENRLEEMAESLSVADVFNTASTVAVGDIVAVECPVDSLWYRGKVIEVKGDEIKVVCIDSGKALPTHNVRELPAELIKKEPLAKHCSLQKPSHISEWNEHAIKEFDKLVDNGNVTFQLKVIADGDPAVVDLVSEAGPVSETLGRFLSNKSNNSYQCSVKEQSTNKDLKSNENLNEESSLCNDKETVVIKEEISDVGIKFKQVEPSNLENKSPEKSNDTLPEKIKQVEPSNLENKSPEKNQIEKSNDTLPEKIEQVEPSNFENKSPEKSQIEKSNDTLPEKIEQVKPSNLENKSPEKNQIEKSSDTLPEKIEKVEPSNLENKSPEKNQIERSNDTLPEKIEQVEPSNLEKKSPEKSHIEKSNDTLPEKIEQVEPSNLENKIQEKNQIEKSNDTLPEKIEQVEPSNLENKSPEKNQIEKSNDMLPEKIEQVEPSNLEKKSPEKNQIEKSNDTLPEKIEQVEPSNLENKSPEKSQIEKSNDTLPEKIEQVEPSNLEKKSPEKSQIEKSNDTLPKSPEVKKTEEEYDVQQVTDAKEANVQQNADNSSTAQHVENIPST